MPNTNTANHTVVSATISPVHPLAMSQAGPSGCSEVVLEGWALKKRRKKMQGVYEMPASREYVLKFLSGFARRYFTLYHSGMLSYSFEPGQPARDHILLPQAAISTAPGRKDIHIDSTNATFHIKCLSTEDFFKWMAAFRCVSFHLCRIRCQTCSQEIHGTGCHNHRS